MTEPPQHRPSPGKSLHNAYIQLLKEESLWQGDVDASLRTVLNHCAEHLQVQRVGLWRFSGADRLYCQLLRDGQQGVHEPALEIFVHDHAPYFAAMLNGRVLAIPDVLSAPETATFRTTYFEPLGITSLLDATLRQVGKTIGVLCIEHVGPPRIWSAMEQNYAISIADLLTQLLAVHALYRTEERYRKVFNSTIDAIFVLQNNRMVECNNASLKLYDCSFEEFARYPLNASGLNINGMVHCPSPRHATMCSRLWMAYPNSLSGASAASTVPNSTARCHLPALNLTRSPT